MVSVGFSHWKWIAFMILSWKVVEAHTRKPYFINFQLNFTEKGLPATSKG